MKHIIIRNLGPVVEADIELKRINVILGPQSSGKSCVLKTACYCTWVEKRIEIAQNAEYFEKDGVFIKEFERFHKLQGYAREDTYISYESDFISFNYDGAKAKFSFQWKEGRWNYKRSKVTYIPAERNMVAAIPNWYDVKMADDNIRSFISDWEVARKATNGGVDVLNLGVKYKYEAASNRDKVVLENGAEVDFTNTSSGLQALVPLFVHLNYLGEAQYVGEEQSSVANIQESDFLSRMIYSKLFAKKAETSNKKDSKQVYGRNGRILFPFATETDKNECSEIYGRFIKNNFCDIFLEEPEENLFPPTQSVLVDWLLGMTAGEHPCNLFVATHSPYVLTSFLERTDLDLGLFLTPFSDGSKVVVKTASEEEIQQVYDYGIDAFFNIEFFE